MQGNTVRLRNSWWFRLYVVLTLGYLVTSIYFPQFGLPKPWETHQPYMIPKDAIFIVEHMPENASDLRDMPRLTKVSASMHTVNIISSWYLPKQDNVAYTCQLFDHNGRLVDELLQQVAYRQGNVLIGCQFSPMRWASDSGHWRAEVSIAGKTPKSIRFLMLPRRQAV